MPEPLSRPVELDELPTADEQTLLESDQGTRNRVATRVAAVFGRLREQDSPSALVALDEGSSSAEPEEHEELPASPFSVDGAQLRALALASDVTGTLQNTLTIRGTKESTVEKKIKAARLRFEKAILSKNRGALKKAVVDSKATGQDTQDLADALDTDIPVREVLSESRYDADFLRSLPTSIQRHHGTPSVQGEYILASLGTRAYADPRDDSLTVRVKPHRNKPGWEAWESRVSLPLHEQNLEWVDDDAIWGSPDEALRSQLEVFGALATHTDTVYTHVTGAQNLPGILTSESWGTTALRGNLGLEGLNAEKARLGEAQAYTNALDQIDAGKTLQAPIRNVKGRGSFISSYYIEPGNVGPIILFDDSVTEHRRTIPNPGGIGIVEETSFDEPSLLGIWVTPTFRENLLHWISEWPDSKKERIFKGRDPETILISTASQLSERYLEHGNRLSKAPKLEQASDL